MGQRYGEPSKQILLLVKKSSCFKFEEIYRNNITDKSQIRYLEHVLGVNKHTSNLAVLPETGHFPMYFSIIL